MARQKSFSVPLLGVIQHTKETKEILTPYARDRKQSEFVRDAVMEFADNSDFDYGAFDIEMNVKPWYVPGKHWNEIVIRQQKSYGVDYTYAIAFWWLKSQPKYKNYNKSKLVKIIISSYQ
jgi:hypothetical protein